MKTIIKSTFLLSFFLISFSVKSQSQEEMITNSNNLTNAQVQLQTDSLNVESLYVAGKACYNLKRYDESKAYLEKALKLDHSNPKIPYYLALINARERAYQSADGYFEQAHVVLNDQSGLDLDSFYFLWATNSLKNKDYPKAIAHFTYSIEYDPGNSLSFLNRGICQGKSGKLKEGCQDFKSAYDLGDDKAKDLIIKYCPVTKNELGF